MMVLTIPPDQGLRIHSSAQIGNNVMLGQNIRIEAGVRIGDGCILDDNVYIGKGTVLGENCHLFPGAVVGTAPQDLSYKDEPSRAIIGNDVQIREYATVHRGTGADTETVIGDGCLLMAYSHAGHNVILGNEVILANAVQLGGYAEIGDYSNLGGGAVVHQHVRIGRFVMVSGNTATRQDIPPFAVVDDHLATIRGINKIGLKRRGISLSARTAIKEAYKLLWFRGLPKAVAIAQIETAYPDEPLVNELIQFIRTSKRGIRGSRQNRSIEQD